MLLVQELINPIMGICFLMSMVGVLPLLIALTASDGLLSEMGAPMWIAILEHGGREEDAYPTLDTR